MQRALTYDLNYHLVDLYQVYERSPGLKMAPLFGHMFYTGSYSLNIKNNLLTRTAIHRIFILGTSV